MNEFFLKMSDTEYETGKIIDKKLLHRGFIYVRSGNPEPGKSCYWECKRMRRSKSCKARAVTKDFEGEEVYVTKFGSHTHPPDHEETQAEEVMQRIKRKAEDDPAAGPSGIIRDELRDLPSEVLSRI